MEKTYYAVEHGYNSRLDEIHAAVLRRKLARLDEYLARRRAVAAGYHRELAGSGLVLPEVRPGNEHAWYLYVVRHPRRDALLEALKAHDIHLNVSYPWPIHTMSGYRRFGGREGDLPATEAAAREIFSLPLYPGLTDDEQAFIVEKLLAALRALG